MEERRSREDISIRHELFSETSLFPSFVVSLLLRLVPFPPTEEHCHCGSGAKGKSVSNVLYLLFASLPLFLSDFEHFSPVFSSAAASKCLQITQLLCIFMFTWTVLVLWFKVLFCGRQKYLIPLYYDFFSVIFQ